MSDAGYSQPASADPHARLPRVLGLTDVMSILVGTVIGSGTVIVPATIAGFVRSPLLLGVPVYWYWNRRR